MVGDGGNDGGQAYPRVARRSGAGDNELGRRRPVVRRYTHTRQQALSASEDGPSGRGCLTFPGAVGTPHGSGTSRGRGGVDQRQGSASPTGCQSGGWQPRSHQPPHRSAGHRHIPLRDNTAKIKTPPRRSTEPRDTAGRQDPGEPAASASAPYRSPGKLRHVWHGAQVERQAPPTGGRPHQRRLVGQPSGESPVALPQLPCRDGHLPGPQAEDSRVSTPRYTRDLLTRTAAEATSMVDLMRMLEAPMGSGPRHYLSKRLQHYGIDTSHFREEPLPGRERRSFPEELLREAAAQSSSIKEMVEYMGLPPRDSPYGYIRRKLDKLGIDTSHFSGGRGSRSEALPSREDLTRAVAQSHSLAGAMRMLGLSPLGGSGRAKVKHSIESYGLSTAHFTGQGHFRGTTSPRRKSAAQILVRLAPGSPRTQTVLLRRALDDFDVPHVCNECGTGENWQGRRLVLELDHINGDRLDNQIENLRYLCPSCHSQTKTHSRPRRAVIAPGPVE